MRDVPVLVCTDGDRKGQVFRVPDEGLRIGRSEDNDVVIHGDGVSRFHAELTCDEGSVWLRDAGSRNGVFVNGNRVTDYKALTAGDVLTISTHAFAIRWEADLNPTDTGTDATDVSEPVSKPWYWPF